MSKWGWFLLIVLAICVSILIAMCSEKTLLCVLVGAKFGEMVANLIFNIRYKNES
jgi:hypothetical protein